MEGGTSSGRHHCVLCAHCFESSFFELSEHTLVQRTKCIKNVATFRSYRWECSCTPRIQCQSIFTHPRALHDAHLAARWTATASVDEFPPLIALQSHMKQASRQHTGTAGNPSKEACPQPIKKERNLEQVATTHPR